MVKVIHFIHGLTMGGAETLVKDYVLGLDKTKFNVTVLCSVKYGVPYEKLLEEGEFTRERKTNAKKNSNLSTIYWCIVVAAFLGYSFLTMDWGRSWIIWPVAGVLYTAVVTIANAARKQ